MTGYCRPCGSKANILAILPKFRMEQAKASNENIPPNVVPESGAAEQREPP